MEISELRDQAHLSASGINDYLECGLLYKFSRIDKRQPESYSDSPWCWARPSTGYWPTSI